MSTITPARQTIAPAPTMTTPVRLASLLLRRITVDEYDRIGESGALDEPECVELIDGYMVRKIPKSPERCYATQKALDALTVLVGPGWFPRKEGPVRIPAYDEPEPDISIARGSIENYRHRHPGPAEVVLVVEVSLTTLDLDRGLKLSAYATDAIPVYWIVNLVERQVEVYTGPGPGAYQSRADFRPGQAVPVVIDGRHLGDIAVDDLLP